MSKSVFIPMEIKSREIDSRFLLALELAKRGYDVFLGEKNKVNSSATESRGGAYFAKSGSKVDGPFFKVLKELDFKIVVLDEEAIVHQDEVAHLKSRFNYETIKMVEFFFSWGMYDQAVALSAFPEFENKFKITGNPRVDLLREDLREYFNTPANDLRDKHGQFVLVPSSFAMCNHYTEPGARIEWRKKMGMIKNDEDIAFYQAYVDHFESIFKEFLKDIPKLARKFPSLLFVVRPHPSENRTILEEAFANLENVKVISEGSVIPWIVASRAVIHNGCTTAVESFLLDKYVISYRPFVSDKYDLDLPNNVSLQTFNYEQLEECLRKAIRGDAFLDYKSNGLNVLNKYISSLRGEFAYVQIANFIDQINLNDNKKPTALQKIKKIRRLVSERVNSDKRASYSLQKFDNLTIEELEEKLTRSKISIEERKEFLIEERSKNLFLISRKNHSQY